MKNMKNTTKISLSAGFTLIEVMITIAIVSILAAIAIPAYNGYILNAKMSEATINLSSLRLAQEEYYLENNAYFSGASTGALETNSGGLWEAAKGSDGKVNFDYVATLTSGWTVTATGNASGTALYGKTVSTTK